jgi:protein-L-isoaspartate(D-aspartate) O-methyltransferase
MDVTSMTHGEISTLQGGLADELRATGLLTTPHIEAAFRAVPRHLFLPDLPLEEAYRNQTIPTKRLGDRVVSSSTQPATMAVMLEQLSLEPGQRVLEIGTGTGYNAALLAHIVGESGEVVTVDIDEDIVVAAREHLNAAGLGRVRVICNDGGLGYPEEAPYDRVILTINAWDIAPAWYDQLRPSGRLVLPLTLSGSTQKIVAFKHAGDHLTSVSVRDSTFMPLRGIFAAPEAITLGLGAEPGLTLVLDGLAPVDSDTIYKLLIGPSRDLPTPVEITRRDIRRWLNLWVALHEAGWGWLNLTGERAQRLSIPWLFSFRDPRQMCSTYILVGQTGLAVLMPPTQFFDETEMHDDFAFRLFVRSYGNDDATARHLIESIVAWDMEARPPNNWLHINVYPRERPYAPTYCGAVVEKRWTRMVLDWREV